MHALIEKARKSAGISSLQRNYPMDPKQRGCGYWAAFLGSLDTMLGQVDAQIIASGQQHEKDLRSIGELEHELNRIRKTNLENGVTRVALEEGWTEDKRRDTVAKLAG